MDRIVRQTAALICCHAAHYGTVISPAAAKEIAFDVHVDIEVPLGYQCVNTEVLNVRAGPSEEAERLHQILRGMRLELWGRVGAPPIDRWGFVLWDEGEGWVAMRHLCTCVDTLLEESPKASYTFPGLDECINTGQPVPELSSEAFHAALEVDTQRPPRGKGAELYLELWEKKLSGVLPQYKFKFEGIKRGRPTRLRLLVNRYLQGLKKFRRWFYPPK